MFGLRRGCKVKRSSGESVFATRSQRLIQFARLPAASERSGLFLYLLSLAFVSVDSAQSIRQKLAPLSIIAYALIA